MNGYQEKEAGLPSPGASADKVGPPPPPKEEMKIRTMESDTKSVEESGGGVPEAETIQPSEMKGGPIFEPETTVPPASVPGGPTEITPASPAGKSKKGWLWLVIIAVVLAVLILGYLYVWPLLFPSAPVEEQVPEEKTVAETPVESQQPILKPHQSLFGTESSLISDVTISDYSVIGILTAIQSYADSPAASGEVKELAIRDSGGQASFSKFIITLLPELAGTDLETALKTFFNDDFTAYLYYESDSYWPGYVVKLKDGVDVDQFTLLTQMKEVENTSFGNLYLTPPAGTPGSFRTGPVGDAYTSRFSSYDQKPASFNYGLFDRYLILATSYKGLLAAMEKLGL